MCRETNRIFENNRQEKCKTHFNCPFLITSLGCNYIYIFTRKLMSQKIIFWHKYFAYNNIRFLCLFRTGLVGCPVLLFLEQRSAEQHTSSHCSLEDREGIDGQTNRQTRRVSNSYAKQEPSNEVRQLRKSLVTSALSWYVRVSCFNSRSS